jgi:hypothetical protein
VVVEQARFFLSQHHDSTSPIGEAFEQGLPPRLGIVDQV